MGGTLDLFHHHNNMPNILIVYAYKNYPPRTTHMDNLYSFRRYSSHKCYYLNMWCRNVPWYITKINFDLILFHYTFFDLRYSHRRFSKLIDQFSRLRQSSAMKIALPQDEYTSTDLICEFINKVGIDQIYSVAPESEWPKIYNRVDNRKVSFFRVLTGYIDKQTLAKIHHLAMAIPDRVIDIGYRVRFAPFLGRFGLLKVQVAELMAQKGLKWGLVTDISCQDKDAFWGDGWFEFLLRCKYTLGVEGGSSLLDPTGQILTNTLAYYASHPQANFEEIEAHCFPEADNSLALTAISPRHLEACATKTCQILIEGEYNGILIPGQHYIELKRDFSNIDQVLDIIKQDKQRAEITARAYHDIVESGLYTYRSFVDYILGQSLKAETKASAPQINVWDNLFFHFMGWMEALSWLKVAVFRFILKLAPDRFLEWLRPLRKTASQVQWGKTFLPKDCL
jgi:hypothetical protein